MPKEQFKSRYMQKHYICVTLVILGFNLESCAIRKKKRKKKEEKSQIPLEFIKFFSFLLAT